MAAVLFFIVFGLLLYTYVLYLALLFVLSTLFGRKSTAVGGDLPGISMIIAAHNEEVVIEAKIQNCLVLDYPRDKLEVVIASDGSVDATNDIVRAYAADRGVTLVEYARVGKIKALKRTVPLTRNEVLVFSDANTMYQPESLRELVRHLADDRVGAVTGDVRLVNHTTLDKSEGLYYKYERLIQAYESDLGAVIGVDGAMYAVKRVAYVPPSDRCSCDDFVTGMNVLRGGYRVLYAPEAVAYEDAASTVRQELRRRVRCTASALRAGLTGEGIPRYYQLHLWFMYLSHKLLRWYAPFLLFALFVLNALCLGDLFWNVIFASQCSFYLLAVAGFLLPGRALPFFIRVPFYFTLQNLGSLLGVFGAIGGNQASAWKSPDRTMAAVAPARACGDGR